MRGTRLRGAVVALVSALAVSLALAGCGDPAPDTRTLLTNAQAKLDATKAFHFVLKTQNAGKPQGTDLSVTGAEGDVQRPDRVATDADVDTALGAIRVKLIVIGNKSWLTNPLTGQFEPSQDYSSFLAIFDPKNGVGSILGHLDTTEKPTDSTGNGTPCWKVSGTVPSERLAAITSTTPKAGQQVPVTVCIGKDDGRLYSAVVRGVVATGDTKDTVRVFYLSKFDEQINIQPPA